MAAFIFVSSDGVLLQNESEKGRGLWSCCSTIFYCAQVHACSINLGIINKEITNV